MYYTNLIQNTHMPKALNMKLNIVNLFTTELLLCSRAGDRTKHNHYSEEQSEITIP